jgi:hypothetical protein
MMILIKSTLIRPICYADAVGESRFGESVVIQPSWGVIEEDVDQQNKYTLKLVHRCIKILGDKQLDFHNASFRTISNIKIIAIHTIQNIITLSTILITGRRRYRMAKVRTAEVPINWYHGQEILIDQRNSTSNC